MTEAHPHVLLVDDNVQQLALMKAILESASYAVTACEGGERAIEEGLAREFDVLILDALMPDVDGFEVCEVLRSRGPNRTTPVAFVTGLVDSDTYEDAIQAGADEILAKPINRSSLLLRVRSLCHLNHVRKERDRRDAELAASRQERSELTEMLLSDLDNPLAVIHARSGLLGRSLGLADDLKEAVADIADAGRSLEELARILMDVLRSTEGTFDAYPEALDARALLHDVVGECEERGVRNRVTLQASVDPSVTGTLRLDEALVRRALLRLVEAGLRAAEQNGVVQVSASADAGRLTLSVHDDGPAIDSLALGAPASDADEASLTGHLPRSRGLGLVFCRLVAQAHGGDLSIESAPGEGTRVRLRLRELPAGPGA